MEDDAAFLRLSERARTILHAANFRSVEEVRAIGGLKGLREDAGLGWDDATFVWKEMEEIFPGLRKRARSDGEKSSAGEDGPSLADRVGTPSGRAGTALELKREEDEVGGIVTFVEDLDVILGGGVPLGQVTEIVGVPGIGKTQLCLQLAADAQIPETMGGVGGEVVYLDTEGSFVASRMLEVATALCTHLRRVAHRSGVRELPTPETMLRRIHVMRCPDAASLVAACSTLPAVLDKLSRPKLVIVDSVAFPFRHALDPRSRSVGLVTVARALKRAASRSKIAVVAVNQMTTVIGRADDPHGPPPGTTQFVPALGPTWAHEVDSRLILHFAPRGTVRLAKLAKSATMPQATAAYAVTSQGIRKPQKADAVKALESS